MDMIKLLRCLECDNDELREENGRIVCQKCGSSWPIINGIPVLIDDKSSVFRVDDVVRAEDTTYRSPKNRIINALFKYLPSLGFDVVSKANYKKISLLMQPNANVLVVGGGIDGVGFGFLRTRDDINLICSDVVIREKTDVVCDGHKLPFGDKKFDLVILQAVLEHVLDPAQCVGEAHRVLGDDGLIYAETPFIQQVHMGAYDFQRFTALGHRRLFRRFHELASGVVCGAGVALFWALIYFLQSFTSRRRVKTILHIAGRLLFFPLKYFDYLTIRNLGSFDGASGFYFLGKKSVGCLSDAELVKSYRGLC